MTEHICSVDDCGGRHYARGYCRRCYDKARRGGLDAVSARSSTPEEWFWRSVQQESEGGCWEWRASRNIEGYGRLQVDGKSVRAHRFAYELLVGPIPEGLVLDHLCRNVGCVNPDHLEPVTDAVNILRGEGYAARAARKTHCPQGHPYSGDNLRVNGGARICRTCQNARAREKYHRIAATSPSEVA